MAVAWEASALFDAFIFALTLMRTLKMRRSHNLAISLTGKGLVDVIVRDGALFFAVMALANFANIFTFYFSRPFLKGLFSAPANCISSALCSRLVLNLYEVATPDDTNLVSSRNPMTTVVLTMPFEFGTMATDDERSEE
ncbi:hypothetical protein F5148DRAFT_29670 [Russula earlei]|uniref:Uncharacterized protein n=1 Tax=Russula earlei TaxID=71964 RepID=A0ACC0U990_9AGAM|nr:hypothetical protein F5148DRAFT_29670 [Russula earlei]